MDILQHYVELFNRQDEELYKNEIDNAHALEWLREEIPLFECPDADLERSYYFRFWVYRKHLRKTEDGYVVTEFLPDVSWSGKHNTINAAFGHHLYEGRWLKNADRYLGDYIKFFFRNPERSHRYSTWFADAAQKLIDVTGNAELAREILPSLCRYYEVWEETHGLENGMLWSIDDRDAMEYSISGTDESFRVRRGIRPTLNSYVCADAKAISELAHLCGESEIETEYRNKYEALRELINTQLLEDGFYRAYHYDEGDNIRAVTGTGRGKAPRELIGYIPWMFCIPEHRDPSAFDLLLDKNAFYTDFGPATAERSHPRFLYENEHECLWNGYVWPFATSQTLNALLNLIDCYGAGEKYSAMFCKLLLQYARIQIRTLPNGQTLPWIDEVHHPLRDDWSSRTLLESRGWHGRRERGKDYNHSTFCDLVIRGIVGVKPDREELTVRPCIPQTWEWFRLCGLHYRGKTYDIIYDKSGRKYGCGVGLTMKEL